VMHRYSLVTVCVCLSLVGCGRGETPAQRSSQALTITGGNSVADVLRRPDGAEAREKAFLQSLRPGGDSDGDPRTIEGVAPDGREVLIFIQTGEPRLFEGMTPAEFAETAYP
jgi:hypothetical protein